MLIFSHSVSKTDLSAKQADLITLNAHKLHGPKGVGALYIKKGVKIRAYQLKIIKTGESKNNNQNNPDARNAMVTGVPLGFGGSLTVVISSFWKRSI